MNDSGTSKQFTETLQQFCQRILPVVQAGAEGKAIEGRFWHGKGEWESADDSWDVIRKGCEYRIAKPKATPLPITPEMWAMIDPKYKFAVMSKGGNIVLIAGEKPINNGGYWVLNNSEYCQSPLAIDTTGIVPELSLTERPDDVAPDNKRKLLFVKQSRILDIYADFLREAGATQDNHVDATHYAESMTGDHVDLYKKMPDKWMIWNYDLRLWQPVQIFGAEPNPIK